MNKEDMRVLLLRSFDEALSRQESKALEAALASSEELRLEREKLEKMRLLFSGLAAKPAPAFTDKVMEKLQAPRLETAFAALLPRVAAASVLFLLATLIGLYLMEGSISPDAIIGTAGLAPEDAYTYLQY